MEKEIEQRDTIVALSTPLGEGGIGIIRMSGENSISIGERIFRPAKNRVLTNYRLHYGFIVDPASGEVLDEVMLAMMKGPYSYTREDVIEIQAHGGPAVLRDIIELILREGARLAGPGEFTRRAFLNGRIDLVQAEAVLALIQAKTTRGRKLVFILYPQFLHSQLFCFLHRFTDLLQNFHSVFLLFLDLDFFFPGLTLSADPELTMRTVEGLRIK